ncbi:MAG: DUF2007 domain-containing protein [Bacteroidetes bacterium]|nr:DUF2007 domain-containing protein [Bacteroidota bacterium]
MRYCPDCGYEYKPDVTECSDCHTEIIEFDSEICANCGEVTPDHMTFCEHCGNFVSEPRKFQFTIKTQERDVVGACVICGDWIHEGRGRKDNNKWFCDDDDHYEIYEDWVVVYTAGVEYQALILKATLESASIPCLIFNQKDSSYVTTSGDLAVIKVMVPKEHLQEAEEILAENKTNETD